MADQPNQKATAPTSKLTSISTDDLSMLLSLAHDLDLSIDKTESPYMKSIYTRLRAEISKDLRKAQAAQEREVLASHRRNVKAAHAIAKPKK